MAPKINDRDFLYLCIKYAKNAEQIKPDFDKIGGQLGITPHTAYCRFWKMKKQMDAEGNASPSKSSTPTTSTPKRKRTKAKATDYENVNNDSEGNSDSHDNPTPSKKGKATVKKGGNLEKHEEAGKGNKIKQEDEDNAEEEEQHHEMTQNAGSFPSFNDFLSGGGEDVY